MTPLRRVAFIGNALPRRCGIATFTTDLRRAMGIAAPNVEFGIVAMTDSGGVYDYPPEVRDEIAAERVEDYRAAADRLNADRVDLVSLQHEYGIFGGAAGRHILALIEPLRMPLVTTLHTVLAAPTPRQRAVMERIIAKSAKLVVMAEKGRSLLREAHGVPADRVEVIPHGIPDHPFVEPDRAKARLGFANRSVILTFGLLSPNKGIEVMIDAMPAILARRSDAVYVVLGATHPNLARDQGENYREALMARARALGVSDHVIFLDRFVDQPTLLEFIAMCDVYVTPYLSEAQMTSGTLAYSFGMGRAVVSTPYWHARELLADGKGVLVPFGDSPAIGEAVADLLTNEPRRQAMRRGAYDHSRPMTWARTAEHYLAVFDGARRDHLRATIPDRGPGPIEPEPRLDHFIAMCDDTGLFQHAVHRVPDRAHGYCVDDNARALLVSRAFEAVGERRLPDALTTRFASFLQDAWNPDSGRFRNFLGFDRRWREPAGSEDSHGRALWALGECSRPGADPSLRRWARALFALASPVVADFRSPRALAFTLLGLDGHCATPSEDDAPNRLRRSLADRLIGLLGAIETPDWVWFENGLAYDNARLPEALLVTGLATRDPGYQNAGLRTLRWLTRLQTAEQGWFRPVGSATFGDERAPPRCFDQQPLEANATIAACHAAWRIDHDPAWNTHAAAALAWFFGANDLGVSLVDPATGACRDGLHADRPNENRGGESVVSYLLGLADRRRFAREAARPIVVPANRSLIPAYS